MKLSSGLWPLAILASISVAQGEAITIDPASLLPPALDWQGASQSLIADSGDPWLTPAERSDFETTPDHAETIAWLERLANKTPRLQLVPVGKSWEGRTIWLAVASADGVATPEAVRATGQPILLAQAGIHSGEIDGKDAGLMLLRDLAVGPLADLLDRDYAKLDTPEIRTVVQVLDRWQPDLYLDLHVTDGVDKQPGITWGFNGSHAHSPAIGRWLEEQLDPALASGLREWGHIPGPHVFVFDRANLEKGIWLWEGGPRYSDGYGGARHIATVLVENHSLKPYKQRVLGTRVLLEVVIDTLAESGNELKKASQADRARQWPDLPLGFVRNLEPEPELFEFLAIEQQLTPSDISGAQRIQWTGKPITVEVPIYRTTRVLGAVEPPVAYWVPAAWPDIIERLAAHGVEMEILDQSRDIEVEVYQLDSPIYGEEPYEGRLRVEAAGTPQKLTHSYAPGSARIPTDQSLGILAVLLLEPASPDSFFQWGFFSEIFQRTEYAEAYVLEPLAEQMLEADPDLQVEFEERLATDEEFAASSRQRLMWFYERSPLLDTRWRLYPVGRELP